GDQRLVALDAVHAEHALRGDRDAEEGHESLPDAHCDSHPSWHLPEREEGFGPLTRACWRSGRKRRNQHVGVIRLRNVAEGEGTVSGLDEHVDLSIRWRMEHH